MNYLILLPVFLPVLLGVLICILPEKLFTVKKEGVNPNQKVHIVAGAAMVLSAAAAISAIATRSTQGLKLFDLMKGISVAFRIDEAGVIFSLVSTICFLAAIAFSFRYIKNDRKYYGFMILTYGALQGLDFSANLVTMYMFFEMVTLLSFPLVLQTKTHESIMAALKYLFYSLTGAYMGLFAIYFLYQNTVSLDFTPGGTLNMELVNTHPTLILVAVMFALFGFGVKAGMFPLHAWLPTAHPVAPAPASAVLSGVIVKAGVLALIRVVYYIVGYKFLDGTWVQTVWMILTLVTVFMGSLLAYREPVLKKRLAYSTVSQISYILFGLAVFNPTAFEGSILHVIFHAFIKCALFLCAGAFIHETGKERVEDFVGIGKKMPITTVCWTIASLGLIGIPPTGGFISKWYLAVGALNANVGPFRFIGPAILLVSAFLTAGYLLPITVKGFFPGAGFDYENNPKKEASAWMWIGILVLVGLVFAGGCFPSVITDFISWLPAKLF